METIGGPKKIVLDRNPDFSYFEGTGISCIVCDKIMT